jgi:hypothetical protein
MQIRTRLTLQFLLIGGIIMISASIAIYLSSDNFRTEDFYNRLRAKAIRTANLLFNAEGVDPNRILRIENDRPAFLQNEKIIILNFRNDTIYNSDENSDIIVTILGWAQGRARSTYFNTRNYSSYYRIHRRYGFFNK